MRRTLVLLFSIYITNFLLLTLQSIYAASPNTISYQGRLRESGQPVSGIRNIQFKLFDASSAGTEVFNSGSQAIYVSSGIFGYQLGSQAFKDLSWATSSYWLEISVGGNAMSPREQINAMPYAFMASTAASLNGSGNIRITGAGNHYVLNGNVGIGTTAPGYKLDVYGLVSSSGIKISKQNGGLVYDDGYGRIEFAMTSWSGSQAILFGASTPGTWVDGKIQVEGNTKYAYDPGMYSRGAAGIFYYNHGGTFNISIATASTGAGNNITTWKQVFNATRDGTVYFNSGGNVGIGTTNPAEKLEVNGNIKVSGTGMWNHSGTQVINYSVAPTAWTDMNLSGVVGNNIALVMLKVKARYSENTRWNIGFRPKGDADNITLASEFYKSGNVNMVSIPYLNDTAYTIVETDSSGYIQWKSERAFYVDVWVTGYIK